MRREYKPKLSKNPKHGIVARPFIWGVNTVSRTVKSKWGEKSAPIRRL
jgi:hypothetical protein